MNDATQKLLLAKYHLAPMAGVTDLPFRLFMRELGAELVISELISSEGFSHGSHRTKEMISVHEQEHPCGIQIFGANPKSMSDIALFCQDRGADFVDINFGCPVPKVVKNGAGSAALKDLKSMATLLDSVRKAITIPLSIKIRIGWSQESINAKEVVALAHNAGVDWVSVHGRTREQAYSGEADWDLIHTLSKNSPLPIIGNGDIRTAAQALERQKLCHGVMIGRAALANPYIFFQIQNLLKKEFRPLPDSSKMLDRIFELVTHYNHPKVAPNKLKKIFVWYSQGMQGKGAFREAIFRHTHEPKEILARAKEFLTAEKFLHKEDNSLSFLTGGHG